MTTSCNLEWELRLTKIGSRTIRHPDHHADIDQKSEADRRHDGEHRRDAKAAEGGERGPEDAGFVDVIFRRHDHSAQQESFEGSLNREMAAIFNASAIVG